MKIRLFRFRCRLSQSYINTSSLSTSRVNDVDNFRPQALKKSEKSCFKIRVTCSVHAVAEGCSEQYEIGKFCDQSGDSLNGFN